MPARQLTKCELELMEIIWRLGRVTVQEVADQLDRPLAYTTVMSTINTLDKKGSIRRCGKTGRAFIYEAVVGRDEVQQAMTADLTGSLYGGSAKALMMSLLGSQSMSHEEIAELKAAIQELEAGS
ncbi:MAG: BlaI/MecI/CopY family transcriptional regulator [Planctomycetota bacterium]|jgi:predicted transcriptional regulator